MPDIVYLLLLLIVSALYGVGETSLVALSDTVIEDESRAGDRFFIKVKSLLRDPGTYVSRMQLGQSLSTIFAVVIALVSFTNPLAVMIDGAEPRSWVVNLCVLGITLLVYLVFQILGNQLPRLVARQNSERQARSLIEPIRFLHWLTAPIAALVNGLTRLMARAGHLSTSNASRQVTDEELRMMVDIADASNHIEDWQNELIDRVLDMGDTEVDEIMTHRTRIVGIEISMGFAEVMDTLANQKFSRLPVYDEQLDDIVGILYIKDLIYLALQSGGKINERTFSLQPLLRTPLFVPEGKLVSALLAEMQLKHDQMAIIIDEYGGTAGLVTLEDILEELVGNLQDEYDKEAAEIVLLGDGSYRVLGDTDLESVARQVPFAEFSEEEIDDFDTLAGLVLDLLGYIPDEGQQPELTHGTMRIKVLLVQDNHIVQIRLLPLIDQKLEAGN